MKKFTRFLMLLTASLFFITQVSAQDILVVDRDGSAWTTDFTDCWPYFQDALDGNGYAYTYYEVMLGGDDGPDLATMLEYDVIIWFTGEVWDLSETMTVNDEANLAGFLDAGGNLFLSAQDYLWDRYPSGFSSGDFPWDYLGLRGVAQDTWGIFAPDLGSINGVAGSLAGDLSFEVQDIFTVPGREGLYIDEIYDHVGVNLFQLYDPTPEGICAVQYDQRGYKVVFTTASFAAIVDSDIQEELMAAIIDYFIPAVICFPYFDAFESYTPDDYLALQAGCWTTWTGAPGTDEDAFVVTTEAYSGDQSVKVDGSLTDLIFPLGDKTEGKYVVSMDMLVASGYGGYYNLMHSQGATNEWAIEIYFASDGTGYIHAGGSNAATFVYPNGEWFNARIYVDLDLDWATYLVNDEFVHAWQWSLTSGGAPGMNQLGVVDIYAAAPPGDDVLFYFDNFYYYYDDGCEYFEDYIVGEYIGLQSPWWTTWSYNPGSSEDAIVTFATDPYVSLLIDDGTDLVRPFNYENFTDCKYGVYFWFMVADGYCGYFNLQKDIVPGVEWGMQVMWDVDGIGTIDAGGAAAATFPFNFDEWYYVELIVDLDNDLGEIWIDGNLIWQWQWSLGCFGTPGAITLGGINVYAWYSTGNTPLAYFDDLCFEQLTYVGIVDNIEVNSNINVYPNPANDFVNVESSVNINEVKIFNNLGQIVYSQNVDNNFVRINTEKFTTGIYHIQINSQDGIKTQKLVIK